MTTLHDALLAQRSVAEQYSQYPDDSVPVEAAMAVLLLDVALAAERRRQGELEYHKAFPEAADRDHSSAGRPRIREHAIRGRNRRGRYLGHQV